MKGTNHLYRTAVAGVLSLAAVTAGAQPFSDGTHLIGVDIEPGTYRAPGGDRCTWERLKNLSGEIQSIIAMDVRPTQPTVEIAASDRAFKTRGCGQWQRMGTTPAPGSGDVFELYDQLAPAIDTVIYALVYAVVDTADDADAAKDLAVLAIQHANQIMEDDEVHGDQWAVATMLMQWFYSTVAEEAEAG